MSLFWNDEHVPAMAPSELPEMLVSPMRAVVPATQVSPVALWVDTLRSIVRTAPRVQETCFAPPTFSCGRSERYGLPFFLVALSHSLLLTSDMAAIEQRQVTEGGMKKCQHCADMLKGDAKVCRYCGREQPLPV